MHTFWYDGIEIKSVFGKLEWNQIQCSVNSMEKILIYWIQMITNNRIHSHPIEFTQILTGPYSPRCTWTPCTYHVLEALHLLCRGEAHSQCSSCLCTVFETLIFLSRSPLPQCPNPCVPYSLSFIPFRYYSLYLNSFTFLAWKEDELFTPSCSMIILEVRPNEWHSKDTLKLSILVFSPPHIWRLLATHSPPTWYNPLLCPTKLMHVLSSMFNRLPQVLYALQRDCASNLWLDLPRHALSMGCTIRDHFR